MAGTPLVLLASTALQEEVSSSNCTWSAGLTDKGLKVCNYLYFRLWTTSWWKHCADFPHMKFMNDFPNLLWTFNILVVNTKIAYMESEIMKAKKMFCCFERDFFAGKREQARALNALCILLARPLGKAQSSVLGRSASSKSLLPNIKLVLF